MNIETKRLLLRAFTLEDLDAIYTIFSDPTVNTFLPWFCLKSHEEAQKFYVDHYENPNILAYAICLKEYKKAIFVIIYIWQNKLIGYFWT